MCQVLLPNRRHRVYVDELAAAAHFDTRFGAAIRASLRDLPPADATRLRRQSLEWMGINPDDPEVSSAGGRCSVCRPRDTTSCGLAARRVAKKVPPKAFRKA
jgi:hypothetical protein